MKQDTALPVGWKVWKVCATGICLAFKGGRYWLANSDGRTPAEWIADYEARTMQMDVIEYQDGGMTAEELQREVDARRFLPWVTEQHTSELSGDFPYRIDQQPKPPTWFDESLERCKCSTPDNVHKLCTHQTKGDGNYTRWKCYKCGQEFCTYLEG